jgi:hypothetical protein
MLITIISTFEGDNKLVLLLLLFLRSTRANVYTKKDTQNVIYTVSVAQGTSLEGDEAYNIHTHTHTHTVHGAVAVPTFFPSASRNEETWWGQRTRETIYAWDSMDDEDRETKWRASSRRTKGWMVAERRHPGRED